MRQGRSGCFSQPGSSIRLRNQFRRNAAVRSRKVLTEKKGADRGCAEEEVAVCCDEAGRNAAVRLCRSSVFDFPFDLVVRLADFADRLSVRLSNVAVRPSEFPFDFPFDSLILSFDFAVRVSRSTSRLSDMDVTAAESTWTEPMIIGWPFLGGGRHRLSLSLSLSLLSQVQGHRLCFRSADLSADR